MLKEIIVPMAAFAFTVTGVSAFNGDMLDKVNIDLSTSQIAALEKVHELRQSGADRDEIHSLFEEAGIDQEKMKEIHSAVREARDVHREAISEAIESNDYNAFQAVVVGSPIADNITSETDFEKFVEAHKLREAGNHEEAQNILDELGIEKPAGHGHKIHRGIGGNK